MIYRSSDPSRIQKINRTQKLLTAEQQRQLPRIGGQDAAHYDAVVYVKFFAPWNGWTWYATEYDPAQQRFFGVVYSVENSDQCPRGEMGYFDAAELASVKGPWGLQIERDIHWHPQTLREVLKREHGVEISDEDGAADDDYQSPEDRAAVAEFNA